MQCEKEARQSGKAFPSSGAKTPGVCISKPAARQNHGSTCYQPGKFLHLHLTISNYKVGKLKAPPRPEEAENTRKTFSCLSSLHAVVSRGHFPDCESAQQLTQLPWAEPRDVCIPVSTPPSPCQSLPQGKVWGELSRQNLSFSKPMHDRFPPCVSYMLSTYLTVGPLCHKLLKLNLKFWLPLIFSTIAIKSSQRVPVFKCGFVITLAVFHMLFS